MALPKEPRQKMINIMYLVLTALLAINISAEILNAFKTITSSLEKSNTSVSASTTQIFNSLTEKMTVPETKEKASIWQPKAKEVIDYSSNAYSYIENLKKLLITEAGGNPADPTVKFKEDDQNMVTRVMIKQGKGKELYKVIEDYMKNVLKDTALAREYTGKLPISLEMPKKLNDNKKNWEEANFYMAPTVGALSILTKFQNDIRNSENKLVTYCHEQVGKVELKFDSFEAIVGQSSKYLMPGQELEISAGLGAFSKTKLPTVTIGGANVSLNEKGIAVYKTTADGIGPHTVNVTVSFTDQDGNPQRREIPVEYTVGAPSGASIALDKMNVLYIGVDNPATIAASGGGDDKVQVSVTGGGGSVSKTGTGKYNIRVTSVTDDCRVSVTVDGKTSSYPFRVRTIPAPVATIGGVASNENMTAGQFKAQTGVGAYIKDFPFELKYSVVSFVLSADNADGDIDEAPCQGNTWSPKALGIIRGLSGGRTVTVDQIRAQGPDGRVQKIPGLTYYIK